MSASHPAESAATQSDPSQAAHGLAGVHVLIAEDSPDQRRVYAELLRQAGADVTLECNAQSAVDSVSKLPPVFDAIILDILASYADSVDAARDLRALGYEGAIIALTADHSKELRHACFQAGCDACLDKPFTQANFIEAIQLHTAASHSNRRL